MFTQPDSHISLSTLSTIELTRTLVLEAELTSPNGLIPEETRDHIGWMINDHLQNYDQPRDLYVAANQVLVLTESVPDIEFMADERVVDAVREGELLAKGRLWSVEYLASVVFTGFGLRMYGVDVSQKGTEPEREKVETVLVPVDAVSGVVPYR